MLKEQPSYHFKIKMNFSLFFPLADIELEPLMKRKTVEELKIL